MSKKVERSAVENAKYEYMKLRFRVALGENVSGHLLKNAKAAIREAVIAEKTNKGKV